MTDGRMPMIDRCMSMTDGRMPIIVGRMSIIVS
jgi:hypothetical protein